MLIFIFFFVFIGNGFDCGRKCFCGIMDEEFTLKIVLLFIVEYNVFFFNFREDVVLLII